MTRNIKFVSTTRTSRVDKKRIINSDGNLDLGQQISANEPDNDLFIRISNFQNTYLVSGSDKLVFCC
jgi:hypothetical protein